MERYGGTTKERTYERPRSAPVHQEVIDRADDMRGASRTWLALRSRAIAALLIAVATASVLSFFVKPRAPMLEMVSPAQELPEFEARMPTDQALAERVTGSFGIAMVLVRNPYTEKNAAALENVRSWAKERFSSAPDFLHPVRVRPEHEPNDTILGALGYNLCAGIHYAMQTQVASFISWRIASFHDTEAYASFQNAYFSLFGKDDESATLLARYQSDKAKAAIDVLLWTVAWGGYLAVASVLTLLSPRKRRFEALRLSCAAVWLLIGVSNAAHAWMSNSIPSMLSGALSFAAAVFFWRPFLLRTRDADATLKVAFYEPGSGWIALSVWLTYSLMAMTILTWIRAGVPEFPDPVTQLLSALNGNFVQDPEDGKRVISRIVGALWIGVSLWALVQRDSDSRVEDELENLAAGGKEESSSRSALRR